MKTYLTQHFWLLAVLNLMLLSSCASYSQMMISPDGKIQRCASWGNGLIGISQAQSIQDDCIRGAKAAGSMELKRSGVIGIGLADAPEAAGGIRILKVKDNSPAYKVGITPGDVLLRVDGQDVGSKREAGALIFGESGREINITILKSINREQVSLKVVSESFTQIYGMPSK